MVYRLLFVLAIAVGLAGSGPSRVSSQNQDGKELEWQGVVLAVYFGNYLMDIHDAKKEIRDKYLNTEIQFEVTFLLRAERFYNYHEHRMAANVRWANRIDLGFISNEDRHYADKGHELFMEKHRELEALLSRFLEAKRSGSDTVSALRAQIRPFYKLYLYSALNSPARLPLPEEPVIQTIEFTSVDAPYDIIDEVAVGDRFRVRIIFEEAPEIKGEPVTVSSPSTGVTLEFVAKPTGDSRVFLTDPILVVPMVDL